MDMLLSLIKACADETRLRIMALLADTELTVTDLTRILGQSQPRISRHLKILVEARVVQRHKEGSWVFFRLVAKMENPGLVLLIRGISQQAQQVAPAPDKQRLNEALEQRFRDADQYFADHVQQWDHIRALHVPEKQVESAIIKLLKTKPIGALLDIGTGTGRMLTLLGGYADSSVGIDTNLKMIKYARSRIEAEGIPNCQVRQGDMYALGSVGDYDTIVIHQVLHYANKPQLVIGNAAEALRPGGRLLLVDFAPHQEESLREDYLHLRLGFTDGQIKGWFCDNDLVPGQIQHLSGGALTVTLWSAIKKA